MDVDVCFSCKKLITGSNINLCNECQRKYLMIIKEYIENNKTANNVEIHRALRIPLNIVNYFIRQGDIIDTSNDIRRQNFKNELIGLNKINREREISEKYKNAKMEFMDEIKRGR